MPAVAAAALLGGVVWMLAHGVPSLVVRRCVSPNKPLAWLGVHLEVLREDSGCAAGQLAVTGGPQHTAGLVLMVAVPTLLANVAMVLGAAGVWVALWALLARAVAAVGRWWPRPPAVRAVLGAGRPAPAGAWPVRQALRAWQLDRSPVCGRGPPGLPAQRW